MVNYISGLVFVVLTLIGIVVAGIVGSLSGSPGPAVGVGVLWLFMTIYIASAIRLAAQWEKAVVFRLGKFSRHEGPRAFHNRAPDRPAQDGRHARADG